MTDNISLLDKLNKEVKDLHLIVDKLTHYSAKDAGKLQFLEDANKAWMKDREELIRYFNTNNTIINLVLNRLDAIEAKLGIPPTTESGLPRKPKSVLQLIQTQLKSFFQSK